MTKSVSLLRQFFTARFAGRTFDRLLLVSIREQKLFEIEGNEIRNAFAVSTAQKGTGSRSGSYQTPLGLHSIAAKHGAGLPPGAVLVSREFTGEVVPAGSYPGRDLITSRILWLKGEEAGENLGKDTSGQLVDSFQRYIYLHGTPEEASLGSPVSHGCVRMANADIIGLYERVGVGDLVWIAAEWPSAP